MAKYSIVHGIKIANDFDAQIFTNLTTLGPAFILRSGQNEEAVQVCECLCGKIAIVRSSRLRSGHTTSCGCRQTEITKATNTTHGRRKSSEYQSWRALMNRCDLEGNNDYAIYGGRGITYCERWKKFENFFADMGEKPSPEHTLDRFPDQNGNYEPSNCRWATPEQQANNTRANRMITIGTKTDTLANWCRVYGKRPGTIWWRVTKSGMTWEEALATPLKPQKGPIDASRVAGV